MASVTHLSGALSHDVAIAPSSEAMACPHLAAHPLADVVPLVQEVLGDAAEACGAVLSVTDAAGRLIWLSGHEEMLDEAAQAGLVIGTNLATHPQALRSVGEALAADAAMCVAGQEHFADIARRWSGAACPIHDPATGAVIGVLDFAGGEVVGLPQTLAMVRAAARMAESELARTAAAPSPTVPEQPRRNRMTLRALGTAEASGSLTVKGQESTLRLTPRQSEIVVLLASSPRGLTGGELGCGLYADGRVTSTLRAEMNKLKSILGESVLLSRPYRLGADVGSDWLEVGRLLADGAVEDALDAYPGDLLVGSVAPGVVKVRETLRQRLRAAVIESGRLDLLATWTASPWGVDDHAMWVAQYELLDDASPLRPLARKQIARLAVDACPVAGPGLASGVARH